MTLKKRRQNPTRSCNSSNCSPNIINNREVLPPNFWRQNWNFNENHLAAERGFKHEDNKDPRVQLYHLGEVILQPLGLTYTAWLLNPDVINQLPCRSPPSGASSQSYMACYDQSEIENGSFISYRHSLQFPHFQQSSL